MSEEVLQKIAETTDSEEIKDLIEEDIKIARENNKLLKRLHRNALIALIAKVVLWLIILGVPLFFLGPYLGTIFSFVKTGELPQGETPGNVFGLPSPEDIQQLLEVYTGQ